MAAEFARNPWNDVIEALTVIEDDNAIVHLGRCPEGHPALAGSVLEVVRDMAGAKAERLARRHLERRCLARWNR